MRAETRTVIAAEIADIEGELAGLRRLSAAQRQCVPGGYGVHVEKLTRTLLALRADLLDVAERDRSTKAYEDAMRVGNEMPLTRASGAGDFADEGGGRYAEERAAAQHGRDR